ncbi:MAG TPA: M20/M25/M40 family metallo-hydrolase [Gemmatimonadaceae bacterium]|nr:M20/M25/M40 family metallo-hydrolase [Gemmatimonadaceae bacterium]
MQLTSTFSMRTIRHTLIASALALLPLAAHAQAFRTSDSVIKKMWQLGIEQSQTERLAQVLIDSIGPRLSGTQGFASAVEWLEKTYQGWGVTARRERYGTWRGWRAGPTHMDLIAPRTQTLDVELLAWSVGTNGRPVEGEVVAIPDLADDAAARQWLGTIRGKFVLISAPETMCRAPQELERNARATTVANINTQRAAAQQLSSRRIRSLAPATATPQQVQGIVFARLDSAGVAGLLSSNWSAGWGVNKIFGAQSNVVPSIDVSCEDYGLLHRMASNNWKPRVRLNAESQAAADEVPMFNVVAELKGTELPNEYVLLSAHLDSWHGATGATDNGTGTLTMLEAMRILKAAYPRPKRTILVGHWGGEEQGTIGSLAFGEDHPEVINGLQVAFNQDNGTWRAEMIEAQGFAKAGGNLARWVSQLPNEISDSLRISVPGNMANTGSDHSSFVCRPAPAFRLQSSYPEYRQYTWHTNRDTYDKIVFDDLKQNATLAAMMAYAASEDPEKVPRDRSVLPAGPNGQARAWPTCNRARRSFAPAR